MYLMIYFCNILRMLGRTRDTTTIYEGKLSKLCITNLISVTYLLRKTCP